MYNIVMCTRLAYQLLTLVCRHVGNCAKCKFHNDFHELSLEGDVVHQFGKRSSHHVSSIEVHNVKRNHDNHQECVAHGSTVCVCDKARRIVCKLAGRQTEIFVPVRPWSSAIIAARHSILEASPIDAGPFDMMN